MKKKFIKLDVNGNISKFYKDEEIGHYKLDSNVYDITIRHFDGKFHAVFVFKYIGESVGIDTIITDQFASKQEALNDLLLRIGVAI